MLGLLALVTATQGFEPRETYIDGLLGKRSILIRTPIERALEPKLSPQRFGEPPRPWEFDWRTDGYSGNGREAPLRFSVFSQESTQTSKRAESVLRAFMRLYEFNLVRLRLGHTPDFNRGIISVYLCYGGEPGGEQRFEVDRQGPVEQKVNSIYLYDLKSFTDPVEAMREVAHEYGHATIPPFGGFKEPEDWANGYLGEKLYLRYLLAALDEGKLTPEDTLGATKEGVAKWVSANVDPLVAASAVSGPKAVTTGKSGMDSFLGLALWVGQIYGDKALVRALFVAGTDPKDFALAASTVAAEPEQVTLNIPPALRSKPVWIPLGPDPKKSKIMGATILGTRKNGWVRIQAGKSIVVVRNYRD